MVSHQDTSFAADMGYRGDNGWMPGVSIFRKRGDKVLRVSDTGFGHSDDFCAVWHFSSICCRKEPATGARASTTAERSATPA